MGGSELKLGCFNSEVVISCCFSELLLRLFDTIKTRVKVLVPFGLILSYRERNSFGQRFLKPILI